MITIITCFRHLSRTPYFANHPERWNIDLFRPFADYGLRCIIVLDIDNPLSVPEWMTTENPNIQILFKNVPIVEHAAPPSGNPEKDTPEYIAWTYNKPQYYLEAIQNDKNNSSHYICLDYDAALWLGNSSTPGYLKWILAHSPEKQENQEIYIPGGWDKYNAETVKEVGKHICWRFCNGCISGEKDTLAEWCNTFISMRSGFRQVYCNNNILPWDVNYVAWLEYKELGPPIKWYKASHDHTMIENIPFAFFISPLSKQNIRERTTPSFPHCQRPDRSGVCRDGCYPSSASVCKHNGEWWMMTRYVNYWMYPTGYYHFYDADQKIRTRNLLSRLDPITFEPVESRFMDDDNVLDISGVPLATTETKLSFGIEDIRLYSGENASGCLKFIGTTLGFSPEGNARIVSGIVDTDNCVFQNAKIHTSTEWCEKNWIPLPPPNKDWFIYKWTREGIVLRSGLSSDTKIITVSPEFSGIIHRFRGSSILMPYRDGYKCVVHWSKEGSPRTYYHAIVEFNVEQEILNVSPGFMFEGPGIEFCIGYVPSSDLEGDRFWVSRFDRDPFMLVINK